MEKGPAYIFFILLIIFSVRIFAAVDSESAFEIGRAYEMNGVSEAVSGLVRDEVEKKISGKVKEWTVEAFVEGGSGGEGEDKKERIKKRFKKEIEKYLPKIAKEILYEKIFVGQFNDEVGEVKETVDKIIGELKITFEERADQLVEKWYNEAASRIEEYLKGDIGPVTLDATDLRSTLDSALDIKNFEWGLTETVSHFFGEAAAMGLKKRMKDVLAGQLPPEAVKYLDFGSQKFAEYAAKIKEKLPGAQLDKLRDKLLHTPLFVLPNGVYCGILAGSAAKHFAEAFKGPAVDPYQLKRGQEVTTVMLWQAANKEGLNVDLASFLDALNLLSEKFGVDLNDLGKIGERIVDAKNKLAEIERKLKEIDAFVTDKIDLVEERFKGIKRALTDFQNALFKPAIDGYNRVDAHIKKAKAAAKGILPEDFNGVPGNWEEAKNALGLKRGLLGKIGRLSPWDVIQKYFEESGVKAAYERLKENVNDRVSGAIASLAAELTDKFGFTGALARVLKLEDIPAQNPSVENPVDPVLLHNGEYIIETVDLFIPGRGLDFRFQRNYRSKANFKGVLGFNWSHNYEERIIPKGEDLIYLDPKGRRFVFKHVGPNKNVIPGNFNIISGKAVRPSTVGGFGFRAGMTGDYRSPPGVFSVLKFTGDYEEPYLLESPEGLKTYFNGVGLLSRKVDRFENILTFEYDEFGRIVNLIDSLGRDIQFSYNEEGLLSSLEDFIGRTVKFNYNRYFDLVSVTSPETGDWPEGKTVRYAYSTGFSCEGELQHNLTRVMDGGGKIYLRNTYGMAGFEYDKLTAQQYGENGEAMELLYQPLFPAYLFKFLRRPAEDAVDITLVKDRRGVIHSYRHNALGNMLSEYLISGRKRFEIIRNGYNGEGLSVSTKDRGGLTREYSYDEGAKERSAQRNLLSERVFDRKKELFSEINFGYDNKFNKLKEIKRDGTVFLFNYRDDGALASLRVVGRDGKGEIKSSFKSSPYGELLEFVDAEGNKFDFRHEGGQIVQDAAGKKFSFDRVGNIVKVKDVSGAVARYMVNALNQVVLETGPEPFLYKRQFYYDENNNLSEIELEDQDRKFRYKYSYDELDHLLSFSEEVSRDIFIKTEWNYGPEGRLVKEVGPEGNFVEYSYDLFGNVLSVVRGKENLKEKIIYKYNRFNDLEEIRLNSKLMKRIRYDSAGRITEIFGPYGGRKVFQYNDFEETAAVSLYSREGNLFARRAFDYDVFGRAVVLKELLFDESSDEKRWVETLYKYDKLDRVVQVTEPNGAVWKYGYDKFGRPVSLEGPLGNRIDYYYDKSGRLERSVVKRSSGVDVPTFFRHDSLGRLTSFMDANGAEEHFRYDAFDNVVEKGGPRGFKREYFYDGLGRIREARTPFVVKYVWDGNSRLVELVDDNGNKTKYEYDGLDRLVKEIFPDGSTKSYSYTEDFVEIKKRDGSLLRFQFDSLGRVTSKSILKGEKENVLQEFQYDDFGRLVFSSDSGEVFYRYDSLSRKVGELGGGRWLLHSYDDSGRVVSVKYPSGKKLFFERDLLGRIKRVFYDRAQLFDFDYSGFDFLARSDFNKDMRLEIERGLLGEVRKLKLAGRQGETLSREYKYIKGIFLEMEKQKEFLKTFRYDAAGRLAGFDGKEKMEWDYDGVGNWLKTARGGKKSSFKYNGLNQDIKFEYDKNGNLLSDGILKFRYDPLDRLIQVLHGEGKEAASYSYDVFNRRVSKKDEGGEKRFFYDGWNVAEVYEEGNPVDSFIFSPEDGPIFSLKNGRPGYLIRDRLSSVIGDVDGEGGLQQEFDYAPFGTVSRLRGAQGLEFAGIFAGGWFDEESGLNYMMNRYYHPKLGRFLTNDPLGYKNILYSGVRTFVNGSRFESSDYLGMDGRRPFRPQRLFCNSVNRLETPEMNLYEYARNNPVNLIDPLGLRIFLDQRGTDVRLHITAEAYGPEADFGTVTMMKEAVENIWTGSFGRYNLLTTFDVRNRSGRADFDRHQISIGEFGISEVDCAGCSTARLYRFDSRDGMPLDPITVAHEVGHFLGITDKYNSSTLLPKPGWDGNLMACVDAGCHLDERNVEEMLRAYNSGRMNIGMNRPRPPKYINKRRRGTLLSHSPGNLDYK